MLAIRKLRQERGWTITELAQRAGYARPFISKIETGNANPTQAVLQRIADVLGVPIQQLFETSASEKTG